jgi:hypothetical protein
VAVLRPAELQRFEACKFDVRDKRRVNVPVTIESVKALVKEMCQLNEHGEYAPILEADLVGFLYHLILRDSLCSPGKIHLDTRIIGSENDNYKFDIVVGEVRRRDDGRPAISPEAIIEVKVFPEGFTDQQHRRRFEHILDNDLRKLGSLRMRPLFRVEFVFDQVDYLAGTYASTNREQVVVGRRNEIAAGVTILFARRTAGSWQVLSK